MKKHRIKQQAASETQTQDDGSVLADRIRKRAYEIHQARGGAPGQDLDDWLQAEREIKDGPEQGSDAQN